MLLLCVLLTASLCAQEIMNRDSLLRLLPGAANDTGKVFLLIHIGEQYEGDAPAIAKDYYRKSIALSEQLHFPKGIVRSIAGFSYLLNVEGDFDSSLLLNQWAVALSREMKDTLSIAKTLFNTGNSYRFSGDYEAAVRSYEEGKTLFERRGNDSLSAIGDDILQGLYTDMKQYEKSRLHGERAVAAMRKWKSPWQLGVGLNNLGNNYAGMRQFAPAKKAYEEALAIAVKLNDKNMELSQYLNLGDLELQQEQYDRLNVWFNKALVIADELELEESKAIALSGLAHYYHHQHQFAKARQLAEQALQLTFQNDLRKVRAGVYVQLSHLAYAMQDPVGGHHYHILGGMLEDSLLDETLLKTTNELEVKYETARKETAINRLEAAHRIQELSIKNKNMLIIFLSILAIGIGVVVFLLYRSYRHRQQLQQLRINELETEKQLMATAAVLKGEEQERARMAKDLHDGLGGMLSGVKYSLNAVRGNMMMTADNAVAFERSLDMLDSSIGEMRRIAHNMLPEALITFGLENALEGFCQDINGSGVLQVRYQALGLEGLELEQSKAIIIYRIVQELLTNTLKHAGAKRAIVQLTRNGDELNITVEDDGKGFDYKEQLEGMGWKNIRNRVSFLNGTLDVDAGKGTSVFIVIPL